MLHQDALMELAQSHLGKTGATDRGAALLQALQEVFNRFAFRAACPEELRRQFQAVRDQARTAITAPPPHERRLSKLVKHAKWCRLQHLGDAWVSFSFLLGEVEQLLQGQQLIEAIQFVFLLHGPEDLFDIFDFFEHTVVHNPWKLTNHLDDLLVKRWNRFFRAVWQLIDLDTNLRALWSAWQDDEKRSRPLRAATS